MKPEHMTARSIEQQIVKYIDDAAKFAAGRPLYELHCYLDGIKTPGELAVAIKRLGASYLEKLQALAKAAPVVRGDTISIYQPKPATPANTPSVEDEAFLALCRKQLLEQGFVLAKDADTYQEIMDRYPDYSGLKRVRGSEAKRWIALHDPDAVTKRIKRR